MINRRQFLVSGLRAYGAWMVGAKMARQILRLAQDRGEPFLVEVDNPVHQLWATFYCNQYVFTLDCPYTAIEAPKLNWRQWLERKGVDVSRPKDIRDFLEDWGWYCPGGGEVYLPPDLDGPLPDHLQQHYLDWEYAMHDAPTAQAYHYLQGLSLADRDAHGTALGSLKFVEGLCPGNNASLVTTRDVETLGGLQQRLLELGEQVQIQVVLLWGVHRMKRNCRSEEVKQDQ